MKYINSFLVIIFFLIPSPTEIIINSFPLNYLSLIFLIIIILNINKFLKTRFYAPLFFCVFKLLLFLIFSSNSYACFGDNNVEVAQSSQFKVSESNCKTSFNQIYKNTGIYSEKITEINNYQILENNTSIQNTTWNLGFINDKKYNYFRDYEQSQLWFPIEAKYFIENSKLNYSEFNLEYSGEVVIYQDNLRIFNEDSYDFLSNELILVDSTKDIIIEYKFKSFATSSSLPGYTYATLVMTDESDNLLRFVNFFNILVLIEIILLLSFIYFCIFREISEKINILSFLLLFLVVVANITRFSLDTVVLMLLIIIYLCLPKVYLNKVNDFLFSFLIATLAIFKFFPLANTIYQHGGTDGLRYESHAREIFLTNSLQGGEDLFTSQPGARYILYVLKNTFGENDVLQKIFILSILFFCVLIMKKKSASIEVNFVVFLSLLYLVSSPVVLLVSESLSETFAWPFIAFLFLIYSKNQKISKTIFFLSGLTILVRLNYFPAIIVFLFLFNKKKLIQIKDFYIFLFMIFLPLFHNLYFGKIFQFWIRSVDVEGNLRLDVFDILSSLLNNLLIIFGDFSNVVIRSYVSTRFLVLQYLIIAIFLITVFFASKKFNMEKLLLVSIPILFLAPHLFFDGVTEYPKHLVAGYISLNFVSLILNKETNFLLSKLKLNSARY